VVAVVVVVEVVVVARRLCARCLPALLPFAAGCQAARRMITLQV
jgi:hypothetical protein